jgi:ornithine cyclodeaminase/alanine dehydrogenase-like protein (mu-crystallin family)
VFEDEWVSAGAHIMAIGAEEYIPEILEKI